MMTESERNLDLQYFELQADQFEAAYRGYEREYAMQNPPPKRDKSGIGLGVWLSIFAVMIITGASMVVSGSRTIAEFGGGQIGWAAFIMLEMAMFYYAFVHARQIPIEKRDMRINNRTRIGLGMAFVVLLAANVHATMRTDNKLAETAPTLTTGDEQLVAARIAPPVEVDDASRIINGIILIFIAVSAPTLAVIGGEIGGVIMATATDAVKAAGVIHEAKMTEWRDKLNASWARKKKDKLPVSGLPLLSASVLSDQTDNRQTYPAASGFMRTPDGQRKVIEYLETNPDDADLPSRQLAIKIEATTGIKIGHDTANRGRNHWKSQRTQ